MIKIPFTNFELGWKGTAGVCVFVLLLMFMSCQEARGDTIWSVTTHQVGGTYDNSLAVGVTETFAYKWYASGVFTGATEDYHENAGFSVGRWWRFGRLEANLGPSAFINADDGISCHFAVNTGLRWNFTRSLSLTGQHYSNGSTCKENDGYNHIGLGLSF